MAEAPQWQIDIPSLSQLVFSAGVHGLKQLALAGVEPHTIGCMLMIAEYTPASQDFRSKLNKARQQQHVDRVWLYKLVEIGACTNFLADQILKTRAGENVLALMAAIATVMDEQSCTAVLLSLFEAAKVSLNNTPGIMQLQRIRSCLAPLADKTGFAEKTLQYHHFFLSLLGRKDNGESHGPRGSPYEGLPEVKDMSKMIGLVHRLINLGGRRCLVRYSGLRGAAWMATYTSYILGLRICAVRADGTPVPMTSSYEEAQVIIEVSAPESAGSLYQEGNLQDLIVLDTAPPVAFSRISAFAAIEVLNEISTLSLSFDPVDSDSTWYRSQHPSPLGFLSFTLAALPDIQARALRILRILGFRPPEDGYRFHPHWEAATYTCHGHESDPPPLIESCSEFRIFGRRQSNGPKQPKNTYESRRGQYVEKCNLAIGKDTDLERLRYYLDDYTNSALHEAANWPRQMLRELVSKLPPPRTGQTTKFESHIGEAVALCSDSMPVDSIEQRLWDADWIGIDIDGIVILRNAAMSESWASMKGAYLGFRRGRILHENQQYTKIRTDRINTQSQNLLATKKRIGTTTPINGCPSIQSRVFIMPMADTIFMRLEATPTPGVSVIGDGSLSATYIPDYLVTTPCQHGYDPESAPLAMKYPFPLGFAEGLFFDDHALQDIRPGKHPGVNVFYQLTSENHLAQWLALQWKPANDPFRCLRIIQKDCCLQCLLGRLETVLEELQKNTHHQYQRYPVCIIARKEKA
ncbi:hypothetical protein BDW72DRAFT_212906 [Aspergillus terricola var. indicus]